MGTDWKEARIVEVDDAEDTEDESGKSSVASYSYSSSSGMPEKS